MDVLCGGDANLPCDCLLLMSMFLDHSGNLVLYASICTRKGCRQICRWNTIGGDIRERGVRGERQSTEIEKGISTLPQPECCSLDHQGLQE